MNPHEAFNYLLDKEIYLASKRTFYRILKKHNELLAHRSEKKQTGNHGTNLQNSSQK